MHAEYIYLFDGSANWGGAEVVLVGGSQFEGFLLLLFGISRIRFEWLIRGVKRPSRMNAHCLGGEYVLGEGGEG